MELFSTEQSDLMADFTAREQAIKNARRDGKDVVRLYKQYILILIVDDDRGEKLKKNFYEIIDIQGKVHMVPGFTYEQIDGEQFRAMVEKLEAGKDL